MEKIQFIQCQVDCNYLLETQQRYLYIFTVCTKCSIQKCVQILLQTIHTYIILSLLKEAAKYAANAHTHQCILLLIGHLIKIKNATKDFTIVLMAIRVTGDYYLVR